MKIIIEIPRQFEVDVRNKGTFGEKNKFVEFFRRVESAIRFKQVPTCGLYEKETAEMFAKAFDNLEIVKENEE